MKRIVLLETSQYNWNAWVEESPKITANGHNPIHALKEMKKALKSAGLPNTFKGGYEIIFVLPDDL